MAQITVTLPDGSQKHVESGTPVSAIAAAVSPRLADAALVAWVNDHLVDLDRPLVSDAAVRIVTSKNPEALEVYRHSTAHLLAAAVTALFPNAQCGIGPPTDDGFFYDFVVERPFVPEDLEAIEAKMRELAEANFVYERQMWPRQDAIDFFRQRGEPLKVQLIEEKTAGQPEVSVYTIKDKDTFVDFCVGPHVPSTGKLKAFKLTTTSNAYWKGDAKNAPMQRVYGTAFFSQKELDEHVTRLEEAKKRDHRKLGKELGLFAFHPWAPGAGFWTGKGATLYNTLADYMRGKLFPAGYQEVKTPIVYNKELWITSGHWSHYRENMFLVESRDGDEMGLKAMNCPGHYLLYSTEKHSYREMPIRFHEQTPLHRNEASGVLGGLTRVRQFSQDDGHCFLMESQIASEVEALLRLIQGIYADFGLSYTVKLATRPEKFIGEVALWDHAEAALEAGAREGRPGLHDQCRRRRVLRAEDRLRHHRRDRPQVAVRHDSAGLRRAGALRPDLRRRRQRRAPPGRDSPRDFREFRAFHRDPDRALRRRLPLVAGPGPGHRPAHCRPPSGICARGRRRPQGRWPEG